MIDRQRYEVLTSEQGSYWFFILTCLVFIAVGVYSAITMEHAGHIISGMNNQVVWGLPHVFAVSLIVSASGALNGATLASVFNKSAYKPIARFSVVLAMSLLLGGLFVLVLDLGRPDRLIIAMTNYNFQSVFAWNIFLYTGFLVIGICYLWMMMERRFNKHIATIGFLAFVWRLILTSGTGCIFGVLLGGSLVNTVRLIPLFIALSLLMGTAVLVLALVLFERWRVTLISAALVQSFNKLLVWFLVALAIFAVLHYFSDLQMSDRQAMVKNAVPIGFSAVFWIGHVIVGVLIPIAMLRFSQFKVRPLQRLVYSSALALFGSVVLLYVVIVGPQSTPKVLFPGQQVLQSRFGDGQIAFYLPSSWEWGLGLGGVFLALLLCVVALRVLPLLPEAQPLRRDPSKPAYTNDQTSSVVSADSGL